MSKSINKQFNVPNLVLAFHVYELIQRADVFVRDLDVDDAIASFAEIIVYQCILEQNSTNSTRNFKKKTINRKRMSTFFFVDR